MLLYGYGVNPLLIHQSLLGVVFAGAGVGMGGATSPRTCQPLCCQAATMSLFEGILFAAYGFEGFNFILLVSLQSCYLLASTMENI